MTLTRSWLCCNDLDTWRERTIPSATGSPRCCIVVLAMISLFSVLQTETSNSLQHELKLYAANKARLADYFKSNPRRECTDPWCHRCVTKHSTYALCAECAASVPNLYVHVLQPTPTMIAKKDQQADQKYKSTMLWWMSSLP